jgi:F-type H+-transporting ATPase subunit a
MDGDAARVLLLIGPLEITRTVVTTWGIMAALVLLVMLLGRQSLRADPGQWPAVAEGVVGGLHETIEAVARGQADRLLPFIGTLWLFILVANLVGILPGLSAPTEDLSTTAALATLVFLSVHWFGVRSQGWKSYLRHYLSPTPLMLPFHIISEISRTVALAVRLFGNMMSLGMTALLVLMVAGFLVPIPILMLHIVEALVQAYIFGMLALIYIAGGIEAQQQRTREERS